MENNKVAQPAVSDKKVFVYERKMEKVVNLEIHPCLIAMKMAQPSEIFKDFLNEFGYFESPVVTEDGFVITHPTDVVAAKQRGVEELNVVVIKNATQDEIVRFISFKHVIKHGESRVALFNMVKFLTGHLKGTEPGRQWACEFDTNKTRPVAAKILGLSEGTIHNIMTIGNKAPELLEKIDNREMTSTEAIKQINAELPIGSRKRYKDLFISNVPASTATIPVETKPKYNLRSISLEYDGLGKLDLSIDDVAVSGSLNGESLGEMSHTVKPENVGAHSAQSHTIIPIDDRFSIQVIIRDAQAMVEERQLTIAA